MTGSPKKLLNGFHPNSSLRVLTEEIQRKDGQLCTTNVVITLKTPDPTDTETECDGDDGIEGIYETEYIRVNPEVNSPTTAPPNTLNDATAETSPEPRASASSATVPVSYVDASTSTTEDKNIGGEVQEVNTENINRDFPSTSSLVPRASDDRANPQDVKDMISEPRTKGSKREEWKLQGFRCMRSRREAEERKEDVGGSKDWKGPNYLTRFQSRHLSHSLTKLVVRYGKICPPILDSPVKISQVPSNGARKPTMEAMLHHRQHHHQEPSCSIYSIRNKRRNYHRKTYT